MEYTIDWFINKFEATPDDGWTTGLYSKKGKHCAYGWCGLSNEISQNPESDALYRLTSINLDITVININDGYSRYQQPTPKQRILAALRDIKAKHQPVVSAPVDLTKVERFEVIRYVTVDSAVRELQKTLTEN